jgi:hypothetical protein
MKPLNAVALLAVGVLAGAALHGIPSIELARAAAPPAGTADKASSASMERRLARVEDHIAIERLLMEYGRTLDKHDFAAFSRLFAANGEWTGNVGTFKGPAGIQAAMEKYFKPTAGAPPFYHVLTNPIIDVDGDRATASSKWTFIQFVAGKPQIGAVGYYDDTLIRENGHWRFLHRMAPAMRAGTNGVVAPSLQ